MVESKASLAGLRPTVTTLPKMRQRRLNKSHVLKFFIIVKIKQSILNMPRHMNDRKASCKKTLLSFDIGINEDDDQGRKKLWPKECHNVVAKVAFQSPLIALNYLIGFYVAVKISTRMFADQSVLLSFRFWISNHKIVYVLDCLSEKKITQRIFFPHSKNAPFEGGMTT